MLQLLIGWVLTFHTFNIIGILHNVFQPALISEREKGGLGWGLVGAWLVGCWVGALLGVGMFPMGPVLEEPRAASAGGGSSFLFYCCICVFVMRCCNAAVHNLTIWRYFHILLLCYLWKSHIFTYFQIAPSDLHLGLTPEGGEPVLTGLGPLRTHER